ncbi:MAG: efflux RND transporter permease subunit [Desulfobacterales bacterium]|nr:efflux RND transporter permease subunit [Desulfobacterales bacterium]
MKGPIKWMAGNHVAANLLMFLFIVGGLVFGFSIKQEVFPEVTLDQVRISVAYPGAGPDEVEEGILLKIEENISGIDGLKEVRSQAGEGIGIVTAVIREGEDPDRFLQDVKAEVDRITTFPGDAERPVITKMMNRREVASLVIYGEVPERTLRQQAEAMRDELLAMDGITQIDLKGVRPYEISIEISEENLRRYGLTLAQVAQRVRQASLDLPGGSIRTKGGEILIRTKERRYLGDEYGDIVIRARADGAELRLRDIGVVRDDFAEIDQYARFNGLPAAMVAVYRVGDQKPTKISDIVHDFAEAKQLELPGTLKVEVWNDTSELFASRMNLLLRNAAIGLVLVFLSLSMFLQVRLALWVMLGIPISFLGALLFMPALGVSINMISLFAFIMALGIVVDDAIVVGENVFEHRRRGKNYLQAAVDGTREVGIPVIFSVMTTVAAFLPLVFVSGIMGKFIRVIPLVVISILLVSLLESLFVLPAHLSLGRGGANGRTPSFIEQYRRHFVAALNRFVQGPYQRVLDTCLEFRYVTLAAALSILLLSVGLVAGGLIKFTFMPEVDGDRVIADLTMPRGTPVEETGRYHDRMVAKAREVVAAYDRERGAAHSSLRQIFSVVGGTIRGNGPGAADTSSGAHLASVALLLQPSEIRGYPAVEITRRWRQAVGELAGADSLTFSSTLMHMGANIDVSLAHDDFPVLVESSRRLKEALAQYPGVMDIEDTCPQGKQELKLTLKPAGRTLGLTEEDLGRQVRSAFYGAEALRLQRGRNEVKVMVRYPEAERRSIKDLESMRLRTPAGGEVPLTLAASVEKGRGYSVINRTNHKRVINVRASVDSSQANAGQIIDDLTDTVLTGLSRDYPGLTYDLEGENQEQRESIASMGDGLILALFAIYALLAIPFRSYVQPFLIMTAIPFGVVGAIAGHLIMGYNLSMLSLFGIVALSGVVVNDSLLLIDQINRNRRQGMARVQAVVEGGLRRFRPILLTSLTTFFGLSPMILEKSVQAKFLIPMAISLGFGVLFATGITLLLIPVLYLILEDFRSLVGLRNGPGQGPA